MLSCTQHIVLEKNMPAQCSSNKKIYMRGMWSEEGSTRMLAPHHLHDTWVCLPVTSTPLWHCSSTTHNRHPSAY